MGVVFPDPEAARAAFALGPVRYRCWVCGRTHVSGSGGSSRCLARAVRWGNWQARVGPLPVRPHLPPSLAFAQKVWEAMWRGGWPPDRVDAGEHLLAVDGLDPRLRAMVQEELRCLAAHYAADLDRLWAFRDEYCRWLAALSAHKPPAVVSGYVGAAAPALPPESPGYRLEAVLEALSLLGPDGARMRPSCSLRIGEYTVRPAVPVPMELWKKAADIALAPGDLWRYVVAAGRVARSWRPGVLTHVSYGAEAFLAVFQRWQPTGATYVVCLERYGSPALVVEAGPGAQHVEKVARALLARRAVR